MFYIISGFCSGQSISVSKVSIQTNIKKCNFSRIYKHIKSKPFKAAINLEQSLKVYLVLKVAFNKFCDLWTALIERPFNSNGRSIYPFSFLPGYGLFTGIFYVEKDSI